MSKRIETIYGKYNNFIGFDHVKILNLYGGLGGNRTLWPDEFSITMIEQNPDIAEIYQKRFPADQVEIGDVYNYLRDLNNDINQFNLIWASPPCTTHSQMQKFPKSKTQRIPIPDMNGIYGLITWLERNYNNNYVIENVQPYYKALIPPMARIDRHIFWSNFPIKTRSFKFDEFKNKHGKIGGIMRKSIDEIISDYNLESVKEDIKAVLGRHSKIRISQAIRNCVDPIIGLYILNQFLNKKSLIQYL